MFCSRREGIAAKNQGPCQPTQVKSVVKTQNSDWRQTAAEPKCNEFLLVIQFNYKYEGYSSEIWVCALCWWYGPDDGSYQVQQQRMPVGKKVGLNKLNLYLPALIWWRKEIYWHAPNLSWKPLLSTTMSGALEYQESTSITFEWTLKDLKNLFEST